ncbi:hypothetical protein [Mycolicibacterium palauense]|uniref:hypothetical protein n=1 Tax=Mycolicibacterium palauense TaxID=2034511 RepID=UPI001FEBD182|nr:hypothetical protein [Mycolicibacterium palauense]
MTADQKSRTDQDDAGENAGATVDPTDSVDPVDPAPEVTEEADSADAAADVENPDSDPHPGSEPGTDGAAEDTAGAGGRPARRRRWVIAGAALLAVLLVASAGLTAWLYFFWYRVDQQTGPHAEQVALQAAKDGTVAVLSYGPDSLDQDLANAKSHLTGDFLDYYGNFTDEVVRPAVAQKKVKTDANVVRAAVSQIEPDKAVVLVFVNQTTTSQDRPDPAMAASSVLVTLSKVDGKWLISSFDPV